MNKFLSILSCITIALTLSAEKAEYQDESLLSINQIIDEEFVFEEEANEDESVVEKEDAFEENDNEESVVEKKNEIQIYFTDRPEICTSLKEIKILDYLNAVIILSDGSQWNIAKATYINEICESWKVGDDIRIVALSNGEAGGFFLANIRVGYYYKAYLSKKCADNFSAVFIKRVDPTGYVLTTTDGRMWVVQDYLNVCTVQYWNDNERVIINKSIYGDYYKAYEMIYPNSGRSVKVFQVFYEDYELAHQSYLSRIWNYLNS